MNATAHEIELAIGLGCRKGVSGEVIASLVRDGLAMLAQIGFLRQGGTLALFTAEAKREEAGMQAAAAILGLPLHFLKPAAMKAVAGRVQTTSPRVLALFGVPSVAETAALAGAGDLSELVLARITRDNVTCAIARAPLIKETAA